MEEAFIAYLLAAGAISTLVSNRVFPFSRRQGSTLPAITVQRIGGAPEVADDGEAGIEEVRMQVDCWATTYAGARELSRAVRDRLSTFRGTTGGVDFLHVELDNDQDLRESGANAAEYLYRVSLDFLVWFEN